MTRTGWIRLGSTILALALIASPSRGAMIRLEFPADLPSGAGASPLWRELADAPLDVESALSRRLDADVRPLNAYYGVQWTDWARGAVSLDWTTSDFSEIRSRSAAVVGDGAPPFATAAEGPAAEPPLTLAGFLGVAAWAVFRRRAERRPRRRRSRPASVRAPGTAIVAARRPRRLDAERPLVLPARFAVVSTTTLPVGRGRRMSNGNLVHDR